MVLVAFVLEASVDGDQEASVDVLGGDGDRRDFGRVEGRRVGFTLGEPGGFVTVSGRISLSE